MIKLSTRTKGLKLTVSPKVIHNLEGVRFAYKFAQIRAKNHGKKLNKVKVKVWQSSYGGYSGRARPYSKQILLKLPNVLPPTLEKYPRYKNMPTFWLWGGSESIVYITAHELGHLIGWSRGEKTCERACCLFGYEAVEAWRDRQYESPACLI